MNCKFCNLPVIEGNIIQNSIYVCTCGAKYENGEWTKKGAQVEGFDETGKYLKKNIYND